MSEDDNILQLSKAEHSCISLCANGSSLSDISKELKLSENTINCYFQIIIKKLGAKNLSHAVALSVHKGLVKL